MKSFYLCLLFFILTAPCFSLTLEEYKTNNNMNNELIPIFTDEIAIVKADSGITVVLRKLNPYYDKNIRRPYEISTLPGREPYIYVENECYYFLLCESEKHILAVFDESKNYIQKYQDKLTLTIDKSYKNFDTYYFNYSYMDDHKNILLWIDKLNDELCGTFIYQIVNHGIVFKEKLSQQHYNFVEDFYIDYLFTAFNKYDELYNNYIDFTVDSSIYVIHGALMIHNRKFVEEEDIDGRISDYREKQYRFYAAEKNTSYAFELYTMSVSYFSVLWGSDENINPFLKHKPDIKYDLPINDDELKRFLDWKKSGNPNLEFNDGYGTPVKFEIITEGLKVTSAGRDKIFGTGDDKHFIRTYTSVGMEPLN